MKDFSNIQACNYIAVIAAADFNFSLEYFYTIYLNSYSFFKGFIILILFIIHVIFILNDIDRHDFNQYKALEASFSGKIKKILKYGIGIAGGYSSYITISNDIKNNEISKFQEEFNKKKFETLKQNEDLISLNKDIENLKLEKGELYTKVETMKLNTQEIKISVNDYINSTYKVSVLNEETPASVKALTISDYFAKKQKLEGCLKEFYSNLTHGITSDLQETETESNLGLPAISSNTNNESNSSTETEINLDDIHKSNILGEFWENFEQLNGYKKLAVSLLFLNSALISALINMVFIYYGDYLIKIYNLEIRFPKLAKLIILRRKFNKYYIIINCLIIVGVILAEVIFSIAVLSL